MAYARGASSSGDTHLGVGAWDLKVLACSSVWGFSISLGSGAGIRNL